MPTFPQTLATRLATQPGQPLVTFYDGSSGERVELSVTTYANWVAKASSLLVDELGLERGDSIAITVGTHWLTPVFLGAAWNVGLAVGEFEAPQLPDAVVCGPADVEQWGAYAENVVVLACSLLPMGTRFADPLPPGVHDVGVEIWSQPDAFTPWDPPQESDLACTFDGLTRTQGELFAATGSAAAVETGVCDGGRLLTVANPASPPGIATLTEPLRYGGSVVLATRIERGSLDAIADAEQVTARFPPEATSV